jgi:ELWxxDGT repeat protein
VLVYTALKKTSPFPKTFFFNYAIPYYLPFMKKWITFFAVLFSFCALAQDIELVKNINTVPTSTSHDPDPGVKWNEQYIYSGWCASGGMEPWVTDGTEEGTHMLNEGQLGNLSSSPTLFSSTSLGVFFRATNSNTGNELYISDGTSAGTTLLKDLMPGAENGGPSKVIEFNGLGYFTASGPGTEEGAIWTTDGTTEGTELFYDIAPGEGAGISHGYVHNGLLYMSMSTPDTGQELYKTDGTVEGTSLVKDLEPGSSSSSLQNWIVYNDELYFTCWNSSIGIELWKTDGTTDGTIVVNHINPGTASSQPNSFLIWNDLLYFSAQSLDGRNLWVTDGTSEGTSQVSFLDSSQPNVAHLVDFNDQIYFVGKSDGNGIEVWKSDGTPSGTSLAYDVDPSDDDDSADNLYVYANNLYFSAEGPNNGNELWRVDGETLELEEWDLNPGLGDSNPNFFHEFNGQLYFAAADDLGYELFTSDGTEEGTFMLLDVNPEDAGWNQLILESLGDHVIYVGIPEYNNKQLYSTDGTSENTSPITNIRGEEWSRIRGMTEFDGYLFFNADDGETGQELWRSDGTPEGTFLYQDVQEGSNGGTFFNIRTVNNKLLFDSSFGIEKRLMVLDDAESTAVPLFDAWGGNDNVGNLEVFDNEVYFSARDTDDFGSGDDLWKTNGTPEGTEKVFNFGTYDISPEKFFGTSDQLWFFGEQYGTAPEWGLYKSDGTSDGTEHVAQHNLDGNNWGSNMLEEYNDGVLYTVFNTSVGRELYFSDGTSEGSYMVQNIASGSESPYIENLVPFNDEMYFLADNVSNGTELWKTDATGVGTNMLIDLMPGVSSGGLDVRNGTPTLVELNGSLLFGGATEEGDYELFISDGTSEGTEMLLEINATGSASPHNFFRASEKVYFTANDGTNGFELWKTDGTALGTEMVGNINTGGQGSYPREFIEFGDHLYFQAYGPGSDLELYRVDQRCLIAQIETEALEYCVGDSAVFNAEISSSEGAIQTFEWNFSDDSILEGITVDKIFSEAGSIIVDLFMNTDQGCEAELSITVQVNETPAISFFGPDEPLCLTSVYIPDNQTTATTVDTEWQWEFGDDITSDQESPIHSFAETGIYNVSLTASNGICTSTLTQQQEVYAPETQVDSNNGSTCNGSDDASIVVSGTSILGDISYSIDGTNYQDLGEFNGLASGELEVFFLDDYGCEVLITIDVPEPDVLLLDLTITTDDGTGNGSIEANGQGGTEPYSYSMDGVNFADEAEFSNLAGGSYTVWITDGNSCTYQEDVDLDFTDAVGEIALQKVNVYPNPVSNLLTIETGSKVKQIYTLRDMTGRILFIDIVIHKTVVDLSSLAAGMYTLQCGIYEPIKIMVSK